MGGMYVMAGGGKAVAYGPLGGDRGERNKPLMGEKATRYPECSLRKAWLSGGVPCLPRPLLCGVGGLGSGRDLGGEAQQWGKRFAGDAF
jgi:hypothetical protein